MADETLTAALRLAKSKKMFFAFIPKGPDGKLIVSKKKILPKEIADAKKELGGGTPVTGKCFGKASDLVFQVAKAPPATLAVTIKKVAKRETGLTIDPNVQLAADADEEDTGAPAAATATAPAASDQAAPAAAPGHPNVLGLQKALQKLGYDPGKIDGILGPHTRAAIKKFQEASGLKADGIAGPKTQAALARALQGGAVPPGGQPAQPTPAPKPAAPPSAGGGTGPAPGSAKPLPVPRVTVKPGGEPAQLLAVAQALDSIQPIKGDFPDGPHYHMTVGGKQVEINQKEVETNRSNARAAFAQAVKEAQVRAAEALHSYENYRKTITTGVFGTVVTFIFDKVSVTDPGTEMAALCAVANAQAAVALAAANANSFVKAANALIAADTAAHRAHALIVAYKAGIESSAETTVSVLEGVKTASKLTLAVGGAVLSGGAAAAAFAGDLGVTAAEDLGPALSGEKVDWGKFALDMAFSVAWKKLGATEQIEKAILAKLGTKVAEKVGETALKEAVAKVVTALMKVTLKKSLETAYHALNGKEVSWDKFTEETKKNLTTELAKMVLVQLVKQ
jgi:peptidoglycan hydrolase-like protein with peptidoglycan-binding domain